MSFRPFHMIGLWLAVMAMPPATSRDSVASWMVGVGQTPYTRWGDWFGWLMVTALAVLILV